MAGPLNQRRPTRGETAGGLRHRVRIEARPDAPLRDASGAEVESWAAVATVWAAVEPVGGREMLRNGQVQAENRYRVTIRHRGDVTPRHRLIWLTNANKVLNIEAAPPTVGGANRLELVCREEV
jgi:SPP1 family predicted phage head-tail adaptor